MSSSEDQKGLAESQLKALVDDAGQEEVARARKRKMSLSKAQETLEDLVEAAGGANAIEMQIKSQNQSTQRAMNALFADRASQDTAHSLVGLAEDGGVGSEENEPDEDEKNSKPTLAGAQSSDHEMTPIRSLDDGVDFWQELETIDIDDSESN